MLKHPSRGGSPTLDPAPKRPRASPCLPGLVLPFLLLQQEMLRPRARGCPRCQDSGSSSSRSFQVTPRVTGRRNGLRSAGSRQSSVQRWTIPKLSQTGHLHPLRGLSRTSQWLVPLVSPSPVPVVQTTGEKTHRGRDSPHTILHLCPPCHALCRWASRVACVLPPTAPHKPRGHALVAQVHPNLGCYRLHPGDTMCAVASPAAARRAQR